MAGIDGTNMYDASRRTFDRPRRYEESQDPYSMQIRQRERLKQWENEELNGDQPEHQK